jgi:quinol-cytochrome oxidoreductase complex cytochrome b subunit
MSLLLGFGYTGYLLPQLSGSTLRSFFAWHVAILPLIAVIVTAAHLSITALLGNSVPVGIEIRSWRKFFPTYFLTELIVWLAGFGLLLLIAWFFPWDFNGEPFAKAGARMVGVPADWYLFFLNGVNEAIPFGLGGLVIVVLTLFWATVPWLDKRALRGERSPFFTWIGIIAIALILIATALAYFSVGQEKAGTKPGMSIEKQG